MSLKTKSTTKTAKAKTKTNGTLVATVVPKTISKKTKDAAGDAIADDTKTEKEAEAANGIEDTVVVGTKDVGVQSSLLTKALT